MKDLISVIVPVYNVEKYIGKCVESIERQTYDNLEIILVDDGSTDTSGLICEELARKDKRIRVFHQDNKGLSEARNKGLEKAKGEYIGFVDADDVIYSKMYEKLYETLIISEADFSVTGIVKYYGKKKKEFEPVKKFEVVDEHGFWSSMLKEKGVIYNVACTKLYRRSLLDNVRFLPGRIHEDEFFLNDIMPKVDKIAKVSGVYYVYRIREDSITNIEKTSTEIMCALMALWDRYLYLKHKKYLDIQSYTLMHMIYIIRFDEEKLDKNIDYKVLKKRVFLEYRNKKNRSKDLTIRLKTYLLVNHFKLYSKVKKWRSY